MAKPKSSEGASKRSNKKLSSTKGSDNPREKEGKIPAGTKQASKKLKGYVPKAAQKRGRS